MTADSQRCQVHRFKPGRSGNPKGRPKGARNKIREDFLADLQADWQLHDRAAIERVRRDHPAENFRTITKLMLASSLHTDDAAELRSLVREFIDELDAQTERKYR